MISNWVNLFETSPILNLKIIMKALFSVEICGHWSRKVLLTDSKTMQIANIRCRCSHFLLYVFKEMSTPKTLKNDEQNRKSVVGHFFLLLFFLQFRIILFHTAY